MSKKAAQHAAELLQLREQLAACEQRLQDQLAQQLAAHKAELQQVHTDHAADLAAVREEEEAAAAAAAAEAAVQAQQEPEAQEKEKELQPWPQLTLPFLLADGHDIAKYLMKFLTPKYQRSMLNASRQLADTKRHLLYWKLNIAQSHMYYESPMFRKNVRQDLVVNPGQQVSLTLNDCDNLPDLSVVGNVHKLVLDNSTLSLLYLRRRK